MKVSTKQHHSSRTRRLGINEMGLSIKEHKGHKVKNPNHLHGQN